MKGTGGRECATAKKVEINLLYLKKDKNIKCRIKHLNNKIEQNKCLE